MHTVDKKDKDAFLDRVVGIGDVALHFKSEFLIFTLNFNQLPETHRNVCFTPSFNLKSMYPFVKTRLKNVHGT